MSKKVKSLIEKETAARLDGIDAIGVLNPRGLGAILRRHSCSDCPWAAR